MNIPKISELFDLSHSIALPIFERAAYPWNALDLIDDFINEYAKKVSREDFFVDSGNVIVSKSAKISPKAEIVGPCIIGHETEIRPFAYIRGKAIIGDFCVIGNSTEIKSSIIFDGAKLPHYNYVGDSVVGHLSHMGAGAIASNVKSDGSEINVRVGDAKIRSGRVKLGSIIGDRAEIGCSCVLNPGTVIGRNATVYPLSSVRAYVPENTIFKSIDNIIKKR